MFDGNGDAVAASLFDVWHVVVPISYRKIIFSRGNVLMLLHLHLPLPAG